MGSSKGFKRSVGLAVAVVAACGALQAATPTTSLTPLTQRPQARVAQASILDRLLSPTGVRETRRLARKAQAATSPSPAVLASFGNGGGSGRAGQVDTDANMRVASAVDPEPHFEPWSLGVALLSVMIFVARRRGAE